MEGLLALSSKPPDIKSATYSRKPMISPTVDNTLLSLWLSRELLAETGKIVPDSTSSLHGAGRAISLFLIQPKSWEDSESDQLWKNWGKKMNNNPHVLDCVFTDLEAGPEAVYLHYITGRFLRCTEEMSAVYKSKRKGKAYRTLKQSQMSTE